MPVAFPLGLVSLALIVVLPDPALTAFIAAWENLFVAGIQAVRPILIPAVYLLYQDLWHAELARRERLGAPPIPFFARVLLMLTKPLPKLGRWQ